MVPWHLNFTVMRTRLQRRLSPAPLLSSDIDVVILAHLNVASLGRCAYVSRGLGAACDQAWRCKAIARWPKIEKTERAVVAAATDPQYKFDWATAFRSTMVRPLFRTAAPGCGHGHRIGSGRAERVV